MILKPLLVLGCGIIPDEQRTVAERGGGKSKERALPYSSGQRAVGVGFRSAGTEETANGNK